MKTKRNYKYVLLAGAPKCGTTSLFRYLSDHPVVCPSNRKETYFFAREFDLKKVCTSGENIADFEKYFSHCENHPNSRLEGTPYTIYAQDAPQKILSVLPDVFVLFVLREPVSRLVSDYKFHVQRGHPSTTGSVRNFLDWQYKMDGDIPNLINQGCYVKFISQFVKVLGADHIGVIFFENLISNLYGEMNKVSTLLNIDGGFYSSYKFNVHNPTIGYRFQFLNQMYMSLEPTIASFRSNLMGKPKMHALFERVVDNGKHLFRLVNRQVKQNRDVFPHEILRELYEHYKPYNLLLQKELGYQLPWKNDYGL